MWGKGNKAVRVKKAEAIRTSLIYMNERAISFHKFFTKMQKMFIGFSENGYILNESQKIRSLFQRVKNLILTQIKALLQVSYNMEQANTVTYDFISSSLAAENASIVYHNPRGVMDVNNCGKKAPESGSKGECGAIFTCFYPNRSNLSDTEKQYIFDERERLNIKGGGKHKSFENKNRSVLHPSSQEKKAAQKIQQRTSFLKAKCEEISKKMSATE